MFTSKYAQAGRQGSLGLVFGVFLLALAACGGGGGSDPVNVGSSGGNNGDGSSNSADGLFIFTDRSTINQDQTARITVIARNDGNVAQPGVEIFFGASDGLLRIERSITNEFGEASAILSTLGARIGTLINVFATTANGRRVDIDPDIQVIAGGGTPSASFNIVGPTSLPLSQSGSYTVTLTDASTAGASGRRVRIQVVPNPNGSGGQVFGQANPNIATTNANGEVNFTYTPPTGQSGTGFIQVSTTDATDNASRILSVTVGQALSITGPDNIPAGGTGSFTATLVNSSADPITGQSINLSSTRGTIATSNATTNSNGQVNFSLNTTQTDGGNTAIITATAPNTNPPASTTFNVPISADDPDDTNGQFTFPQNGDDFNINVFSRAGFNLPGPASDVANQQITISTTRGQIGDDVESPTNLQQSRTFTTDGAGNIAFRFTSSEPGPATFTASGSGASAQLNVNFVATPSTISAQVTPATIATGASTTLSATIRDTSGNLLPNTPVNFFVDFDGSRNNTSSTQGLSATSATTNAQGQASVTFTSGPRTGSVSLRAAIPNGAGQSLQLTVNEASAGGGASFTFVNNDGQFTLNEGNAISFNLQGGASAGNQPVTISTSLGEVDDNLNSGLAAAASRTFTTNAAGDINFFAISDTRGPATISASGPDGASAQTTVEYVGTPGSISTQPGTATIAPNEAILITATVLDSSGNGLEGAQVNFIVDNDNSGGGSNISPQNALTNSRGRASATFTAGPNSGNVGIRSTSDNGRLSAGTQLTVQGNRRATFNSPASGEEFNINTAVPVSFTLTNSDGSPSAGQDVTFGIGIGGAGPGGAVIDDDFNAPPAAASTRTFTTDGSGNIPFQIMSSEGGSFQISVSGSDFGSGLGGRFIVQPDSIEAQASPTTVSPNQSGTVTVTVRDNAGDPVGQRTGVDFEVLNDNTGGATVTAPPDSRTSGGTITADYTVGPNTGTVQIRATASGSGLTETVTITVQ